MAEGPARDLQETLLAAFDPYLNRDSPSLPRVLLGAFRHANLERAREPRKSRASTDPASEEVVIDKQAILAGIVADGFSSHDGPSTSGWLLTWLESESIDPRHLLDHTRVAPERVQTAFAKGARVIASRSLTASILPKACEIARLTVRRDRADLRHLFLALLDSPGESLELLDPTRAMGNRSVSSDTIQPMLTPGWKHRLKVFLVEQISVSPEAAENLEAWRQLIEAPAPNSDREESVPTLSDAPAVIDSLGRQTFAEVLAARIKDVGASLRKSGRDTDSAFILHIDGSWGSGKSSVLNFLRADLQEARWLVVEFNAWRNQHRKPAWLPLILEVRRAAIWQWTLATPLAWMVWLWWRLRMDWMPYLFAILLIAVAGLLAWWAGLGTRTNPLHDAGEAFKALGAIVATIISVLAVARGFTLGSHRNAESYLESKSEPFRRIVRLFEWLVWAVRRPVAVFVDDLDRCDGNYVIDLLEGIQTSLRAAPIVYIVAGDRKWICTSFEKRYVDFCDGIGTPGRPLGYLFLDKVFQLSTSLPRLSARRQAEYWRQLLERTDSSPEALLDERQRLEAKAATGIAGKTRQEDIQVEIDKTKTGTAERESLLAAAAKQTASAEAVRAVEHRLQPLAPLLEANPRAMKRLVNAYGLNQARAYLEDRKVSVEALARWTIIELRWPLLADYVARAWPDIDLTEPGGAIPPPFGDMLKSRAVLNVIGKARDKGRLTKRNLAPILD